MDSYRVFNSMEEAERRVPVNRTILISIKTFNICLAHTAKGWFAIEDECPHLGDSLSKGTINYLNEIICPWHSYRFSLEHGSECAQKSRDARVFEIEIKEDSLFINV